MIKHFMGYLTESIRTGLPHIHAMNHEQFSNLTRGGQIHIENPTEKTDGATHMMGWDEKGFYTQSSGSGSERMRNPEDFHERAQRRAQETGRPYDPTAANMFSHAHHILKSNKRLQGYLRNLHANTGEEVKIRGELFYRPYGKPSEDHPGEIRFVGTSYDPSHMGSVGKYVIHSSLPENFHIDPEEFSRHMSTKEINFDHDKIDVPPSSVDVSKELKGFDKLNKELLSARTTPSNREAKMAEVAKFDDIKRGVSEKVDDHIRSLGISPKWGSEAEGLVAPPDRKSVV